MKQFFKVISIIFMPLLIPTYGMLLLVNMDVFSNSSFASKLTAVLGTFLFSGVLPFIPIFMLVKKNEISDYHISKQEERTFPYIFTFLAYVFLSVFLYRILRMPLFITAISAGSALAVLVVLFINLRWKISAHLTAMGGLLGAIFCVTFKFGSNAFIVYIIAFLAAALVALARIELKAHTKAQTIAGFNLGFCCALFPGLFF